MPEHTSLLENSMVPSHDMEFEKLVSYEVDRDISNRVQRIQLANNTRNPSMQELVEEMSLSTEITADHKSPTNHLLDFSDSELMNLFLSPMKSFSNNSQAEFDELLLDTPYVNFENQCTPLLNGTASRLPADIINFTSGLLPIYQPKNKETTLSQPLQINLVTPPLSSQSNLFMHNSLPSLSSTLTDAGFQNFASCSDLTTIVCDNDQKPQWNETFNCDVHLDDTEHKSGCTSSKKPLGRHTSWPCTGEQLIDASQHNIQECYPTTSPFIANGHGLPCNKKDARHHRRTSSESDVLKSAPYMQESPAPTHYCRWGGMKRTGHPHPYSGSMRPMFSSHAAGNSSNSSQSTIMLMPPYQDAVHSLPSSPSKLKRPSNTSTTTSQYNYPTDFLPPSTGSKEMLEEQEKIDLFNQLHQGLHLWEFLMEVLLTNEYQSILKWSNRELGIFKIVDSEALSKFWGDYRRKPNMNYDKMSRAIRYYYGKDIIDKGPKRLHYQFMYHSHWWERLEKLDPKFKISAIPTSSIPTPNLSNINTPEDF